MNRAGRPSDLSQTEGDGARDPDSSDEETHPVLPLRVVVPDALAVRVSAAPIERSFRAQPFDNERHY